MWKSSSQSLKLLSAYQFLAKYFLLCRVKTPHTTLVYLCALGHALGSLSNLSCGLREGCHEMLETALCCAENDAVLKISQTQTQSVRFNAVLAAAVSARYQICFIKDSSSEETEVTML